MRVRMSQIIQALYCIIIVLLGVFYLLANFWKSYPGFWGLVIIVLALIALVLSACDKQKPLRVLFALLTLAQIPALLCWIKFQDIEFGFLGHYQSIGWLGFAIHLLLTLWGVVLFLKSSRYSYSIFCPTQPDLNKET